MNPEFRSREVFTRWLIVNFIVWSLAPLAFFVGPLFIALAQLWLLRQSLSSTARWWWIIAGVVGDVVGLVTGNLIRGTYLFPGLPYPSDWGTSIFPLSLVIGPLVASLLQWPLLRSAGTRAMLWPLANLAGCAAYGLTLLATLHSASKAIGDPFSSDGYRLDTAACFSGGILYGLITSFAVVWMLSHAAPLSQVEAKGT